MLMIEVYEHQHYDFSSSVISKCFKVWKSKYNVCIISKQCAY